MIAISAVLIPLEGIFAKLTGTVIVAPLSADTESTLAVNPLPTTAVFTGTTGVDTAPPSLILPEANVEDTLARLLSPNVAPVTLTVVLPEFNTLNVRFANTPF